MLLSKKVISFDCIILPATPNGSLWLHMAWRPLCHVIFQLLMQKSLHRQSKGYSGCLAATYRSLQAAILRCFICVAQIKHTMSTCAESPVLKGVPPGPHAINLSDTASVYHQVCSRCCCCPKRTSIHAPVYVLEFFSRLFVMCHCCMSNPS